MNPIGGYFELELNQGKEYHADAIKLNLGHTAFEYVLRAKNVKRVFIPYYTCEVMLEPLKRTGMTYEFYHIDNKLEPIFDYNSLNFSDYFLYTNYFGIKDKFIDRLSNIIKNLIIDNSQAFFSMPRKGVDTFYSPRKFFGVPDGGYLYTDKILDQELEIDNSSDRFGHLIGRIENGAEESYLEFKESDHKLFNQPIKQMSRITQRLLQSINYSQITEIRRRNFQYLHEDLASKNLLNFDLNSEFVPMVYPYWTNEEGLRNLLIENKIYVAQYWPNVLKWVNLGSNEFKLVSNIVHLPLDQRYNFDNLENIINIIKNAR